MNDQDFEQLIHEVFNENKGSINEYMTQMKDVEDRILSIHNKLEGTLKSKCGEEYNDLQTHFENSSDDKKKHMLDKFRACAEKYDYGFNRYLEDLIKKQNELFIKDNECLNKCKTLNMKPEIKSCMQDCMLKTVANSRDIVLASANKLNFFDSKL